MLDWLFKPTCPCDSAAKDWIESRLEWLAGEFEASAFTSKPVILPTKEFFPEKFDESDESVRALLDRVCGYMEVAPESVRLEFIAETKPLPMVSRDGHAMPTGAAGTYQEGDGHFLIRISEAEIPYPMSLVGTMAHELSHVRLLGERRRTGDEFDNEILTDLTVVHQGLGIFLANLPRNWDGQYTKWPDSDLLKPEYMTPPMYGWALAHLAWFRNERKPAWAKHLNFGAKANFHQGLRYLNATADSWYRPERLKKR